LPLWRLDGLSRFLDLISGNSQLDVYAAEFVVRPPAAPTKSTGLLISGPLVRLQPGAPLSIGESAQVSQGVEGREIPAFYLSGRSTRSPERWYGYFASHSVRDLLALLDTLKR
jgi:hypothetical protein